MFKNILVSAAVLALVDARAYSNEAAYLSNQDKLVQIMSEESDSSDDEEENIQMYGMTAVPVPDAERFSADDDDLFMRSVLANYVTKAGDVDKAAATACAKEVLCTHKGIFGADLDAYLSTYFAKAWGHFDVNQTGGFAAIKMPQFIRFLASDQYFQFMFPKSA